MTKSTKNGKVIYNFLDADRDNVQISYRFDNVLNIASREGVDCCSGCLTNILINQTTAKDLIKVLQEFVETGELK